MGSIRTAVPGGAAAALLTMALCSGCGSSPKPLTRAQLVARADAICRQVTAKLETVNKGRAVSTPQQIARAAAGASGFEQSALDELGKLTPPAALEADWKRFVAGAQSLADDTASLSESVNDPAVARRVIASAEATQKQMAAIAKRNGFTDCEQVA